MERSATTPDAFIASLPEDQRADVATLDAVIAREMAGLERVLWEGVLWGGTQQRIIGYGADRYTNRSGRQVDWYLVGLARQKDHITLYANAVDRGTYLIQDYATRLGKVRVGSAHATFRHAADVDHGVLRELLRRTRTVRGI
jgi:hypothetical protein